MSLPSASAKRRKQWTSCPYPATTASSSWQQEDCECLEYDGSGKGKGPKGNGKKKQAEMDEGSRKGKGPKGKGKIKQAEMDHDEYHDNDRIALPHTADDERERKAFLRKLAAVPLGQASDGLIRFAQDLRDGSGSDISDSSLESEMSEHDSWDSERSERRHNILERNHNRRMGMGSGKGKGRKGKGNMHLASARVNAAISKHANLQAKNARTGHDDPDLSEAESWDSERDEERSRLLNGGRYMGHIKGKGKGKLYQDATDYKNAVWISLGRVEGSALDTAALSGSDMTPGQAQTLENAKDMMRFVLTLGKPHQPTTPSFQPTLRVLLDCCENAIKVSRTSKAIAYLDAVRYSLERCKLTHIHSDHIGS